MQIKVRMILASWFNQLCSSLSKMECIKSKDYLSTTYFSAVEVPLTTKDNMERTVQEANQNNLSNSVGDITEVQIPDVPTHYSVTAVLNYCKSKILKPYLRMLNITGLRPLSFESANIRCLDFFSYLYTLQVILFMTIGYLLQYMACFRRDRGFGYKLIPEKTNKNPDVIYHQICDGSVFFSYIIPNILHLAGYLYAVATFRSSDDDQLTSLMERVFLSLSSLTDGCASQKKLIRTLWIFVTTSVIWILLSFISVNFLMAQSDIDFKWLSSSVVSENLVLSLKVLLILSTFWHDMVQATVISNYCLQAQLLTSYINYLRAKVTRSAVQPVNWMRDIEEFKKLLGFFNRSLAPAVCIFSLINITCSISGLLWILNCDYLDKETYPIMGVSLLNVGLWIVIATIPFIYAARLSTACTAIKSVGHEVRVRPFVHQSTPSYKLDSILLYSSSLRMHAKLFGIPITGRYLKFFSTLGCLTLLVLGQLHYLNAT